jgi:hypothetical protein
MIDHCRRIRGKMSLLVVALTALVAFVGTSSANAEPKGEYAVFAQCPTKNPELSGCIVGRAEKGKVTFGKETVPIEKTQTLQGGFIENEAEEFTFVGAANGETLSKTPQKVPGGLSGLVNCTEITNEKLRKSCESIFENKITGVYATIELAAPASEIGLNEFNLLAETGTALQLPVKVKVENPLLGESCYIGSNEHPIVVPLTTGTTSPKAPNKPIKGKLGHLSTRADGEILVISENSLVNNELGVPGANGCGTAGLLDSIVDARLGIPAGEGHNTVILEGTLEQTGAEAAREHE